MLQIITIYENPNFFAFLCRIFAYSFLLSLSKCFCGLNVFYLHILLCAWTFLHHYNSVMMLCCITVTVVRVCVFSFTIFYASLFYQCAKSTTHLSFRPYFLYSRRGKKSTCSNIGASAPSFSDSNHTSCTQGEGRRARAQISGPLPLASQIQTMA